MISLLLQYIERRLPNPCKGTGKCAVQKQSGQNVARVFGDGVFSPNFLTCKQAFINYHHDHIWGTPCRISLLMSNGLHVQNGQKNSRFEDELQFLRLPSASEEASSDWEFAAVPNDSPRRLSCKNPLSSLIDTQ